MRTYRVRVADGVAGHGKLASGEKDRTDGLAPYRGSGETLETILFRIGNVRCIPGNKKA